MQKSHYVKRILKCARAIPRNIDASVCRDERIDPALRTCLRCDKSFKSEWIGNRLCPSCKRKANRELGLPRVYGLSLDVAVDTFDELSVLSSQHVPNRASPRAIDADIAKAARVTIKRAEVAQPARIAEATTIVQPTHIKISKRKLKIDITAISLE